jgi:hypothetical protein
MAIHTVFGIASPHGAAVSAVILPASIPSAELEIE